VIGEFIDDSDGQLQVHMSGRACAAALVFLGLDIKSLRMFARTSCQE
jgi:hypothetical protein